MLNVMALHILASANSFTLLTYRSETDSIEEISELDYFLDSQMPFRSGDLILITDRDGGHFSRRVRIVAVTGSILLEPDYETEELMGRVERLERALRELTQIIWGRREVA
tara:strand:- start:238 stop:567 length:330 start_codon:yes stop_codon:yes gene_type:complete